MRHKSQPQDFERTKSIQNNVSSASHTSLDSSDVKEKKERPKPSKKKQERARYDEWFESAYALGWVAARQGESVILKMGWLAGCSRHWKEVEANLDYYLALSEPAKPGQFEAVLRQGLQQKEFG